MQKVNIICIGKIKEKYFADAIAEYSKRLSAFCKFTIIELPEEKLRGDNPSEIAAVIDSEGKRIMQKLSPADYVIAMCIEGKLLSSTELSETITRLGATGSSQLVFLIGGSFGLHPRIKEQAALRLSMSPMTFPHHLARVMLLEQIYRAYQIAGGSKYHK